MYWRSCIAISKKADSNQNGLLRKNLWIENDKKGRIDNEENNFEEMGGTYIRHGDYLYPCSLPLPKEEEQRVVGVWGQRHLRYLKEYRRLLYLNMLTSGRLNGYLADIEEQAQERFERLVEQMKQAQGITEQLKVENVLEWIGRMNNIQVCAREIVG